LATKCKTYESLSSSFNIGKIINTILRDLVFEYNSITIKNIEYKSNEYYNKLYQK
jgi:hypothetical protein